jgi:transcriptional regulator with XRE-family HTH domain
MTAGQLLREWRRGLGLTQEQVAQRMGGWSQAAISAYENGESWPDVDRALRIVSVTEGAVPIEAWKKTGTDG